MRIFGADLDAIIIARHISGRDHNHREAVFEIVGLDEMDRLYLSYKDKLFRLIPERSISIGIRDNDCMTNPPKRVVVPMHFVAPRSYSLNCRRYH